MDTFYLITAMCIRYSFAEQFIPQDFEERKFYRGTEYMKIERTVKKYQAFSNQSTT